MDIGKFSYYCRKTHRFFLVLVILTGLIQMGTGLGMKYPTVFSFMDQGSIRLLHFQTAGWFSIFFGVQMFTGIILYITPWLIKTFRKPLSPPPR